ncbi:MAG: hypothetical protein MJZ00_07295 [Paludibacteraceae bacterium]|nr:hypothetical protein [Paludibacteraceae bacterium]
MEILFNEKGVPLMMSTAMAFMDTVGMPKLKEESDARAKNIFPFNNNEHNRFQVGEHECVSWGSNNDWPDIAIKQIRETTVLNTGLKFIRNFTMGQGIFPCRIKGYDDDGNELLDPVHDVQIESYINSRSTRRMMEKLLRDYLKVGSGLVHFVPNKAGNKIVGLDTISAQNFRHTVPDEYGNHKSIVSAYFPLNSSTQPYSVLPALNDFSAELQVDAFCRQKKFGKGFVMPIRDTWSNDSIYSEPIWLPAYISGWVEIAHLVPRFLRKAYENQITWKWHVQIPYSYWDKRYPENEFRDKKAREKAIQKEMDDMEKNLCGAANAEKPLFTHYAVNELNGRAEEEWKITALDNKYRGGENLVTSAAANSEILFAIMVNPNVLGAGMPGGTYAGNQGGSNIREAFLVNIANAWVDRQALLDPLMLFLRINGVKDIQLRFRNTVLTTLDKGAGTQKVIS